MIFKKQTKQKKQKKPENLTLGQFRQGPYGSKKLEKKLRADFSENLGTNPFHRTGRANQPLCIYILH